MPQPVVRVRAWAKVNLHLGVHTQRDAEGYHRVDSVMAAISLADDVIVTHSDALEVSMEPAVAVEPQLNSAYRAAALMGEALGRVPRVAIHVRKRIPMRAGLGGPSTDAAAVICALCRLWEIDVHDERVLGVARSIGADVPFFLYGPVGYLGCRGDVMEEEFEPLPPLPVVLVKPEGAGVAALAAYQRFDERPVKPREPDAMRSALRAGDADAVLAHIANNLAPAACDLAPEICAALGWLREQSGVRVAEVSGSGSCSFAVCESDERARMLAVAARQQGWWSYAAHMEKTGLVPKFL